MNGALLEPVLETTWTCPTTEMEFILVRPGSFIMGSDRWLDSTPTREVQIRDPFYLSRDLVTQLAWGRVMGANPSHFHQPERPVETVNLETVSGFITNLGQRADENFALPGEAQWEYACRAGTRTDYFWGENPVDADDYVWHHHNSETETQPVGSKKPNPWGFRDMIGNVWEWTRDGWHEGYEGAPLDETPWKPESEMRVVRGGSWNHSRSGSSSAFRRRVKNTLAYNSLGFRVVRLIP